ncbi:MAG: Isoleucine--tRNA ligase [Pseudomonadota bacterium]
MAAFRKPEADPDFPRLESEILDLWDARDVFQRSIRGDRAFVFYDGPPFATGRPHYGHLLAGTLKDIVPRYWAMRGYRVERRFGWDTHGLPVEMEIEKDEGLSGPRDIERFGIANYNEACRGIVQRYTEEWREVVRRIGRWVDFDNDYKTMDSTFMESVWWVFDALWQKGLVYQGYKVMPYSWRLGTPLSNFEANMDYRRVQDPAVTVRFPITDASATAHPELAGATLLAWTTTPWTLPSNVALCVGPAIDYAVVEHEGERLLVAEPLREKVLGEAAVAVATIPGAELVGLRYEPIFSAFPDAEGAYRVVADDYVTTEDGTGIVHQAPAFGEDDWRVCEREGIALVDATDMEGRFREDLPAIADGAVAGMHVKEADKLLIADLKARGRLFRHDTIDHEYPFCWRSGTPLIYKAISTWFVRVTDLRERMSAHNATTRWVPEYVGNRRFGNWLEDARDWAISRNRYWGTPLPIWSCPACGHHDVVGSVAALEDKARAGGHALPEGVQDLHRHHIDALDWDCPACGNARVQRTPEVLDCWFESGAMPYAQNHYPFENRDLVEENLPAHFIAEGLDQTRGWFYTLLVLSTALFDRPAFRNVIVNGLILAEDGQKMSKRLKNYPDPADVLEQYGADALRAYLINSPVVRAEPMRFSERGVREVVRSVMLPLWNCYAFFATYAAADGWTPPATATPVGERALLDRWLVSMTQTLVADVHAEMEAYRLYNVIPRVLGFVDHLTNWYIRRSRRRFWRNDDPTDKQHAYETLYEALGTFSRLLAPILPFAAELLYQRLEVEIRGAVSGDDDSVHLQPMPMPDDALRDPELEAAMAAVREVVALGRNLREQHKLPVRQPLPTLEIAFGHGAPADLRAGAAAGVAETLLAIAAEELNVKSVVVVPDVQDLVTLTAKANFKTLGRRLGPKMKEVAGGIAVLDAAALRTLREGGTVEVAGEALGPDDVLVVQQPKGEGAAASAGDVTVRLDTQVDEALRLEYVARELVNRVQNARKTAGLEVEDRIVLSLRPGSDAMRAAIDAHGDWIAGETLTVAREALDAAHQDEVCGGEPVAVAVQKA